MSEMRAWTGALLRRLDLEPCVARVVLATVRGSAPREAGACMLIGGREVDGTIGGGQLEFQAIAAARGLLGASQAARLQRVVLAADVAQCCGGVVELWIECYGRADLEILHATHAAAARGGWMLASRLTGVRVERELHPAPAGGGAAVHLERGAAGEPVLLERLDAALPAVWLYGAGHVGQALARILRDLPFALTWIDSRAERLPRGTDGAVAVLAAADPVATVAQAPAGARFLVLTHSHALDYALCLGILGRADFGSLGLIGSASKAARFRNRLARDGVPPAALARLVCPVGIEGIASKWPAAIAVGIAAQLLRAPAELRAGVPASEPFPAAAASCEAQACARCAPPRAAAAD